MKKSTPQRFAIQAMIAVLSCLTLYTVMFAQKGNYKNPSDKPRPSAKPTPNPTPQVCATPISNTNYWTGSGGLDTTFGSGGIVTTDVSGPAFQIEDATAVLVQSDGKIVTVGQVRNPNGTPSNDMIVSRYDAVGSLDTTFGDADPLHPFQRLGYVFIAFTAGYDWGKAAAIDANGNIVVVGSAADLHQGGLARLDPNGQLDSTFGTGGKVILSTGPFTDVTLQSDGKILVSVDGSKFTVARFNSNGSLDGTFGTGGIVSISATGARRAGGSAYSISTQVVALEERIVLTGMWSNGSAGTFTLMRFKPSGAVDTSFGTNGIVLTAISGAMHIWDHKIDSLNRIVVAGDVSSGGCAGIEAAFARYLENGALDLTFSSDGFLTRDVYGSGTASARSVVIQPDGKIVAAGYGRNSDGTYHDSLVFRLLENGDADVAFGPSNYWGGGLVTTDIGGENDYAFAVALQSDGRIVTGGHTNAAGYATSVIRYLP